VSKQRDRTLAGGVNISPATAAKSIMADRVHGWYAAKRIFRFYSR